MNKKTKSNSGVSGGALYTFDLKNKIGGLPAQIALTNTNDSDCPQLSEKNVGFSNYAKLSGGRTNAHKKQSQHKSHKKQSQNKYSRKSQKSSKNKNKNN